MAIRRIVGISTTLLFIALLTWSTAQGSTLAVFSQAQDVAGPGSDASKTPLMLAIRDTDKRVFRSLIDHADVNAKDDHGWTALMVAVRVVEPTFVKALLKKGAEVNVKGKDELTPLIITAQYAKDEPAVEIAKMLIEHKADVNAKGFDGVTALMTAAMQGKLKLLKLLLEHGANLNDEDNRHATALTYAMRRNQQETLSFLKSAGATGPAAEPYTKPPEITAADQRPVPLNAPQPQYTEMARKHGVEGAVTLRVLVGADGLVKQIRVTKGLPDGLTDQAMRAASELKFKPAMKNGQPVPFWQLVYIEFRLRKGPGA